MDSPVVIQGIGEANGHERFGNFAAKTTDLSGKVFDSGKCCSGPADLYFC